MFLSFLGLFSITKILPKNEIVTIDVDGKTAYVLPLCGDRTVTVEGPQGKSIVEIRGKMVRISDSPCPNKLCVRQGWTASGAIVCVPNRVVVTISGYVNDHGGIDAVTR